MSLVSSQYHKKKRVIDQGKELDLLSSPPRIPSCAHKPSALHLPPAPSPPAYWTGAAAAARRTREVADELYWAAIERGDDAAATESGLTAKAKSMRSGSASRPGTAMTTKSTTTTMTTTTTTSPSVLDHVSKQTKMPLSRVPVAPNLRNMAATDVRFALRGRAQWEHNQRRLGLGMSAAMKRALEITGGANGGGGSVAAASRPGTAGTVRSSYSATSTLMRPTSASPAGTTTTTRPSTAGGASLAASTATAGNNNNMAHLFSPSNSNRLGSTISRSPVCKSRPASATELPRWKQMDEEMNSNKVASREIFEFERRCATTERYARMQLQLQQQQKQKMQQQQQQQKQNGAPCASRAAATTSSVKPVNDSADMRELREFATALN